MALIPLASMGNYFHIYDFRVKEGKIDEFVRLFNEFDYSEGNPMHKSPAQVKDGVLVQDVKDAHRFWLIAEWSSVEEHARSNAACRFPALRSPVCFASRFMGPILPGRLSVLAAEPDSC